MNRCTRRRDKYINSSILSFSIVPTGATGTARKYVYSIIDRYVDRKEQIYFTAKNTVYQDKSEIPSKQ